MLGCHSGCHVGASYQGVMLDVIRRCHARVSFILPCRGVMLGCHARVSYQGVVLDVMFGRHVRMSCWGVTSVATPVGCASQPH